MKWSERSIARALAQRTFNRKYLVVVPNCNWTGYECDILAVTENLRIIDVEIKISRADLKADAKKDKWWQRAGYGWEHRGLPPVARAHPPKVWKHYYALPEEIWTDDLIDKLGSPASGVLLLSEDDRGLQIRCRRPAKPCRDADKLTPTAAVNIARLASLRMWDAYQQLDAKSSAPVQNTSGSPAATMEPCTESMDGL